MTRGSAMTGPPPAPRAAAPAPTQTYRDRHGTTWETAPERPDSVRVAGGDGLWWPLDAMARLHGLTPNSETESDA